MILNAQTATAIYANLKNDFQKGISEAKVISKPLVEIVKSDGAFNIYGWLGHVPGFRKWIEGQPRVLRNVEEKSFSVYNEAFEDTISISKFKVEDNQIGSYGPLAKAMGAAGELLMDQLVFGLLNNGFSTTLGYDGLTWFNDSHLVGESTIDNVSDLPLTQENFIKAYNTITGYTVKPDKLSEARPLNPSGKYLLVVPPALQMTAIEIVGVQLASGGGTNKTYGLAEILVSSWLTSPTAWFIMNIGSPTKPIFFQDRTPLQLLQKTEVNDNQAFMSGALIYGAERRCAACPTFPWLAYGSTGDGN